MQLKIIRTKYFDTHTIGQLYIDGELFSFVLEDVVREEPGVPVEQWKIWGETAIPTGEYPVTLEHSAKFGPDTISIGNVPGFKYIRIHAGNTAKDTEGCPIVGYKLTEQNIIKPGTTRPAVADLKLRVKQALFTGDKVNLIVENA